ncbi:MAG: sulfurtransferase [Nitrospirota bacterium]
MRSIGKGFVSAIYLLLAILFIQGTPGKAESLDVLIKPSELSKIMGKPGVVIVEATEADIYKKSHIPGAVVLPISKIKMSIDKEYQRQTGLALRPEKVEEILGSIGISNDSRVIIYDSGTELDKGAGLAWTVFTVYGHNRAQILSGGKKRWEEERRPLTADAPVIKPSVFKANPRNELVVTADWLLKNLKRDINILDARLPDEYTGESSMGHIPGAKLLEWHDLQDPKETFKSPKEVAGILNKKGVTKDKETITYCNWGPKAAFLFSAMKSLGYNVRIYWGGIDEWSSDQSLPIIDESAGKK